MNLNNVARQGMLGGVGMSLAMLVAGCGGGGGTATPTATGPITQPVLPGTVIQVLQSSNGGLTPVSQNSDGSYSVSDLQSMVIEAQTTQGLSQSLYWGFSAVSSNGLSYTPMTSGGGYQVQDMTDPILQAVAYSGIATVPSVVTNPTGNFPLQFSSLIGPGGNLVLGLGQQLNPASGPYSNSLIFRIMSAYAGNWSVDYRSADVSNSGHPAFSGSCLLGVTNSGVVSGTCTDPQLGSYGVTGHDYGTGNAFGMEFQGKNGVITFFNGTSPVATNQLQGKTNLFVTYSSSSSSTSGSGSTSGTTTTSNVSSIFAQDPIACRLVPGASFIQIANPQTCASTNQVVFPNSSGSTTTGATSTSNSSSGGTAVPVTWTATKTS